MKRKQNRCFECLYFTGAHCLAHNLPTQPLCFCKLFELNPELEIQERAYREWLAARFSSSSVRVYHAPIRVAWEIGLTETDLKTKDAEEIYYLAHGTGCSKRTRDNYRRVLRLYAEFLSSSKVVM